jgi:hypothetical protein
MAAISSEERRRRARDLVRRVGRKDSAADVLAEASTQLRRLLSFDAAVWLSTDPITGLPVMPTRVEDVEPRDPRQCADHWRHEFLVEDVNLFRDLARAPVPAAALRATLGDPRRSTRYRTFLQPDGFTDELTLFLSHFTVRDHIKAIFGKVGVTSRGQLVARLYTEFYEPLRLGGGVEHVNTR